MTKTYKRPKLLVVWNKDLTLSFFANGKLMMGRVKMYDKLEETIKPIMTGWFNSNNPKDWRYRLLVK